MFKKLLTFIASLSMVAAFAAVDVNKGTEAELDSVKGIGPATSKIILAERKKAEFKNWDDLISRVKGLGGKTAAKLSDNGLTVGGASYKTVAAKPAAKAEAKTEAKAPAKTPAPQAVAAQVAASAAKK